MRPTGTAMVLESDDTRVSYMVRGTMQVFDEIVLLPAPLRQDCEARRWYTEGGETCIALSEGGKLLEPLPTFGPSFYAVIATEVDPHEANRYALTHGYCHARNVN
jgi:hypothetical protein